MKVYDSDIRSLLFHSFLEIDEYVNEMDTVVINEMDVCAGISRADIAVINGKMHGYEIKSGQDNLDRLPKQIESYNQVFDTMTIVAFQNHIAKLKEIVPKWWGIKCVTEKEGEIRLKTSRKGKLNRDVNVQSVVMLLWRDEMIDLLLTYSDMHRGYKSKTRFELSKMIVEQVDNNIIKDYVRQTLKSRTTWKAVQLQQLNDDLRSKQPS